MINEKLTVIEKKKPIKTVCESGIENVNDSLKNTRFFGPIFYFFLIFFHKKQRKLEKKTKIIKSTLPFLFFEKRNV